MLRASAENFQRASTSSLIKDPVNIYAESKSPVPASEIKNGALRDGPAPVIWSKGYVGLLLQEVGMGVIYMVMYSLVYPFLNNYLRMSGYMTASAYVLISLPYTLKLMFGIIIDCNPIMGYRRRPYMVIGAGVSTICCTIMAFMPVGDPYYPEYDWAYLTIDQLTQAQRNEINYDAPGSGAKWVVLMVIANMGIALDYAAAGGLVVEISQCEPENVRGTLQILVWVFTDVGMVIASLLVGFGLNSADYGGTFSGSIGVNAIMAVCAVVSLVMALSALLFIAEERAEKRSMTKEIAHVFDLMQTRVVYQVLAFLFFFNMCTYMSVTASSPIASVWAGVEPLTSNIISICSSLISMLALTILSKYGLNWNWRTIIICCQIIVVLVDSVPTFLTIWDVVRNQWFWLGLPLIENIPSNFSFMVSSFCMVEIMEEGNEASFYGLLGSVSSLASPFATVITKNIDARFDITTADLQIDDTHVRMQVSYAYIVAYAFKLFAIVFVVLLPPQKAECQQLRRSGGKSKLIGVVAVVAITFLFVWTVVTNVMTIFPSTSCYIIAGGSGCS